MLPILDWKVKVSRSTFSTPTTTPGRMCEKAAGLARFPQKHGSVFGRIEVIRVVKGRIERLRLHESGVRDKVAKVSTLKHLQDLLRGAGLKRWLSHSTPCYTSAAWDDDREERLPRESANPAMLP